MSEVYALIALPYDVPVFNKIEYNELWNFVEVIESKTGETQIRIGGWE